MGARRDRVARWARTFAAAAIWALIATPPLFAHPLAPALLELREPSNGNVDVRWKVPAASAPEARLTPRLPSACTTTAPARVAETDALASTIVWSVHCPAPLAGEVVGVDGLDSAGTQALLRLILDDGRVVQRVLTAREPSFTVPTEPRPLQVVADYVLLGVEHILTGPDHLLFVFGLLLLIPVARSLAWAITGFTLGHSMTLTLAVLGYAALPPGPVEVLIALSVFALAVELTRERRTTVMQRFPWIAAAGFGLLHGLGFAGALRQVGLPASELPLAMVSFNGGIELGQLAFVAAVLIAGYALARSRVRLPGWTSHLPAYAMGSLAAFWSIQRAAALLP